MEPLFALVVAGIAGSIAYLVTSARRQAQLRVWRVAALQSALAEVAETEGGLFEGATLRGRAGALQVRLEGYRRGKYERGTRIVVSGLGHGAGGLSLRREGFGTAVEKHVIGEREIETGDPAFDAEYFVQGREALVRAILEPRTRQRLEDLLRGRVEGVPAELGVSLQSGVLEVRVEESGFSSNRERIPEILAGVLDVARILVAPPDLAARIAANLGAEPEARARLKAVLVLAREFADHAATREALRAALEDPSEEVRLHAALALGEEGRATLLDLVGREGVSDSSAARAVEALGERLPDAVAEATLRRALVGASRPRTASACLDLFGRRGRPGTEGLLRDALGCEDEAIAVAAARALGRSGTVASVVPLREAGERGGGLRRAARQAIAEIQSRLAGAEPGQLSLATGDAGALSLADGEVPPPRRPREIA